MNLVTAAINTENLPDKNGYFGEFGGSYLPPQLEKVMKEVEEAYEEISADPSFISELKDLNEHDGITVSLVTHEPEMATFAKRIVHFRDGRIESDQGI